MQLFSPHFYSVSYDDYQVLAFTLLGVMLRSFGRKPVRRTEQNKERNASFFLHIYNIYILFFLAFFASSLFRPRSTTTLITTILVGSATYKGGMRVLSLSSAQEYRQIFEWERKWRIPTPTQYISVLQSNIFILILCFRFTWSVTLPMC
jgi:hypothetical protein